MRRNQGEFLQPSWAHGVSCSNSHRNSGVRQGVAEVTLPVATEQDLVEARSAGREFAGNAGCSAVERTIVCTVISELARNIIVYGGGGEIALSLLRRGERRGIRIVARDCGPGIPDLEQALTDGYSTIGALGLGLPGTRRIVDEFMMQSEVARGTTVTAVKWLSPAKTAAP